MMGFHITITTIDYYLYDFFSNILFAKAILKIFKKKYDENQTLSEQFHTSW